MTSNYPRAMSELGAWATEHGTTVAEARHRFAQYAALCGIASNPALQRSLVFKGGNAIDFAWFPNRSTRDLDFSLENSGDDHAITVLVLEDHLERAFRIATARFGIAFAINSMRQHPPGDEKTFVTFEARIGYGLSDEPRLLLRMQNKQPSPHLLPIDISINEPICESVFFPLDAGFPSLRIGTVEEIVSEKLRALLQQPIRNRHRRQDLLDIAILVQANPALNRDKVRAFLLIKANARDVPVSKAAFHRPELSDRARLDYDELAATTRTRFIPFDEAVRIVLALVEELYLPDEVRREGLPDAPENHP